MSPDVHEARRTTRTISLIGALGLTLAGVLLAGPARADGTTPDGLVYAIGDGAATVTGYTGARGVPVDIPATITEGATAYPVTAVGDMAFKSAGITGVTLHEGLTTLGVSAFQYDDLGDVDLPASVTTLGLTAFASSRITHLTLHDGLSTIGTSAFQYNDLTTVDLPDSVTSLGQTAFASNPLTSLSLGAGVDVVGPSAFTGTPSLRTAVFRGPAPRTIDDASDAQHSFDRTVTIRYEPEYDASQVAGGFTSPQWHGYASEPFAAPVLDGATTATARAGQSFGWTPTRLSGVPAPVVSATGLPDGLTVDPASGVVSGTLGDVAPGRRTVTLTAANGRAPDATLVLALTVAPGPVASLELTASDTTPAVGDTVTLGARGLDEFGNPVGDVTADTVFGSDVAGDEVEGDQVRFTHASPHTITGRYAATDVSASIVVQVGPAAGSGSTASTGSGATSTGTTAATTSTSTTPASSADPAGTLPDTGNPVTLPLLALGALLVLAGGTVLALRRRGPA